MKTPVKTIKNKHRGIAMILAMVFVVIFSAISIGFLSLSSANTQVSVNHRDSNNALAAALSGLDCAKYIAKKTAAGAYNSNTPLKTNSGVVSDSDCDAMWSRLCNGLKTAKLGNLTVNNAIPFNDDGRIGWEIKTPAIPYDGSNNTFRIRFYQYTDDKTIIYMECTGNANNITRKSCLSFIVKKDDTILKCALAGRGRMWITGDTTLYGRVYSSWDRAEYSPFNMTSDSGVYSAMNPDGSLYAEGSVNTVLTQAEIDAEGYQLETLGANGKPMFEYGCSAFDINGNSVADTTGPVDDSGYLLNNTPDYDQDGNPIFAPVYDQDGNRILAEYENRVYTDADGNGQIDNDDDNLLGYHEGANYGQPDIDQMPGLNIADYNTSAYKSAIPATTVSAAGATIANGKISTSGVSTVIEYFPHKPLADGGYAVAKSSSSLKLTRYKYENKTLSNVVVGNNTNALFKNCTFNDVLYIDSYGTTTSSNYNNVRFENCTFNGAIVTNTPNTLNWQRNTLYFTGTATFNNVSVPEATILAPHFNVNLGNTNPVTGESNNLSGVIVGGIVDVRGNAQIHGTIISMCDTNQWTSGFVTNIGATEGDGGTETTEAGDIGTIEIDPSQNPRKILPNGITTPVIFDLDSTSYYEPRG